MNQNYDGLFENWEIGVAKKIIRNQKGKWKCLERIDEEDLLQECLTHWLLRRETFNPESGAKKNTFMARVILNKLMDIVREQSSDKRKVIHQCSSLHQPVNDEDESPLLIDTLASKFDLKAHIEIRSAIEHSLSLLTSSQQKLCKLLKEENMRIEDLSKALGVERTTVYRQIKRIRQIFENEGVKIFLK